MTGQYSRSDWAQLIPADDELVIRTRSNRLNAVVTYKIIDARKAVCQTDDVRQALYRETQLVLRSVIGARELDAFLTEKDAVATEIEENVRRRAGELGLEIASVGIRDVILPGDRRGRIDLAA